MAILTVMGMFILGVAFKYVHSVYVGIFACLGIYS
jgi:hypothetical protein